MYEYIDSNGLPVASLVRLDDPALRPLPHLLGQERSDADISAEAMALAVLLISKRQKNLTTDDPWQMWRYYNNAQVARLVLDGEASIELLDAFAGMLAENQLSDPDYYGSMDIGAFARFLLRLNAEFMVMGLELETEGIRQRRLLKG